MSVRSTTVSFATALAGLVLAVVPTSCGATRATRAATAPPATATAPPGSTPPGSTPPGSTPSAAAACSTGAAVLARAAGTVAQRIYDGEAHSAETESDKRQIETYAPLSSAVQSGDKAATQAAVYALVYSHTHIVRLRVERGSELLSDIGGPYILAPVPGTLRAQGKTIGHFVFSVQDDLGYVKLVARFIGAPLVLRTDSGNVPVEGLLSPGPARIPDQGPVRYRGASYQAYSFKAGAYPSGRLRVSLLLPISRTLAKRSCYEIKAAELGAIAQRISQRFALSPSIFPSYIRLANTLTHALVYVRSGSHTLAGSTHATPPKLPSSGALRWHGVAYEVASFSAPTSAGQARVYVLVAH